jgi:hypothetical protein
VKNHAQGTKATMPLVITPEAGIPLPFDVTPDEAITFRDRARIAVNTIKVLTNNGAKVEITDADKFESHKLFTEEKSLRVVEESAGTLLHLDSMLTEYDKGLINSATRLKHYVTNRLLEESNNPDSKIKIKALELLGKIGDVGLFNDKVEVVHTIKTSKEIEQAIMGRLEKYMGAIDVVPDEVIKVQALDRELQDAEIIEQEKEEREAKPFVPNEFSITDIEI